MRFEGDLCGVSVFFWGGGKILTFLHRLNDMYHRFNLTL